MDLWNSLDATLKLTLCGTIAGAIGYMIQKYWTNCPLIGWLGPDVGTFRKRLTAGLLALGAGATAYAASANFQTGIAAAITTYLASQATFLAAEKTAPSPSPLGDE